MGNKKISCEVCKNEISDSARMMPEVADYEYYFCCDDCIEKWDASNHSDKNIAEMIFHPAKYYNKPSDVLKDDRLSKALKLKTLFSWKNDALGIERANKENMGKSSRSYLKAINDAILQLKKL